MPTPPEAADIKEIRVEHTPCYGHCPVYDFTFWANGTAVYHGEMFVPRIGEYRGKIARGEFRVLANLIIAREFRALKDRYEALLTDLPSVITTVTADSWQKRVHDYGHAGPDGLIIIELALDLACTRVKWRKIRRN